MRLILIPQVTGVGYNGDGDVTIDKELISGYQSPSIARIVEVGCVCNNARIRDDVLYGQPTEGALLALSMKVGVKIIL